MLHVPFSDSPVSAAYAGLAPLPVAVALDNVRSMYNVGAFFRTADATGIQELLLGGITACPPKREITKTALGAELTVPWRHFSDVGDGVVELRHQGYEIAAIETNRESQDMYDWTPRFPVCIVFGHETEGMRPELLALCDTFLRIPMLGHKHSLNVSTAGGVVLYELLRQYRRRQEEAR